MPVHLSVSTVVSHTFSFLLSQALVPVETLALILTMALQLTLRLR